MPLVDGGLARAMMYLFFAHDYSWTHPGLFYDPPVFGFFFPRYPRDLLTAGAPFSCFIPRCCFFYEFWDSLLGCFLWRFPTMFLSPLGSPFLPRFIFFD